MKKLVIALSVLLLLLVSCAPKSPSVTPTPAPTPAPGIGALGIGAFPAPAPPVFREDKGLAGVSAVSEVDRKVIRSAYLNLVVKEVSETFDAVARLAQEMGGYVVSSSRQGEEDRTTTPIIIPPVATTTITIRVEASKFDQALSRLRGLAVRVDSENTSSQDVTQEYVDLQAQLRNLEATEARYLKLLERTETVEDVLKVEQVLSEVRGRIESLKGRIQYLERSSALALITVYLRPATSPKPIVKKGWSAIETIKDALRRLANFGQSIAGSLLWVGIWALLWLPLLILIILGIRWLRHRLE